MEAPEELVRYLSRLSRVELRADEVGELLRGLEALRRLIERLLEAPVDDLPPMHHPLDLEGVLDEDEPRPGLSQEEALANAAGAERGFFRAPRTVEEG